MGMGIRVGDLTKLASYRERLFWQNGYAAVDRSLCM